ncbi:MAG: carboxypeptidase-like regulatory domain-containing protein, partial [Paramuribaculum sp.]|nr:carboxypeptidase-like regulatory domain-containing protein [Paramuribaculum sp.]
YSPKNFLGNNFEVNITELSLSKRFWLSAFGYVDAIVKGGHVWSRSPYPNLLVPNANLSYTIQPESFALLNPMEFVTDSYAMWDLTYWANGAILNYVPLIRKLKLREVFSFRGFYGHLSRRNDPLLNPSLFRFPEVVSVERLGDTPYMEVGVGLDNIFKILRVDYVWRLTYRHVPGADRGGVRVALHFTF